MNASSQHRLSEFASRSLVARLVVLSAVMFAAFVLASPVAVLTAGRLGLLSCALAAAVCWAAGKSALVVGYAFQSTPLALYGLLVGMSLRMILPLAAAVLVVFNRPLLDAGMIYYLIVFYMIMLVVDVVLLLPPAGASALPRGSTR